MAFSDRYGHVPALDIQRVEMNSRLRNGLWNIIHTAFEVLHEHDREWHDGRALGKVRAVWGEFFGGAIDQCNYAPAAMEGIRDAYMKLPWFRVYDLVEFVVERWDIPALAFNQVLEREHSAYRVSDDSEVIEVTDENQLEAINEAMRETSQVDEVHKHLASAQQFFAQRDDAGYRNCIKEAISAVETLVGMMVGDPKVTLGRGLPKLEGVGVKLHKAQVLAWQQIYGYTNDRPGVRHGSADEANGDGPVTSTEALYMLVTCSSFVTYLLELAADAKISLV